MDLNEIFQNASSFSEIDSFNDIALQILQNMDKEYNFHLSQAINSDIMPIFQSQIEDFYVRNSMLNKKSLPAAFKVIKQLENQSELIEVNFESNKLYYCTHLLHLMQNDSNCKAVYLWQETDEKGDMSKTLMINKGNIESD
jgi:hypothetical protein